MVINVEFVLLLYFVVDDVVLVIDFYVKVFDVVELGCVFGFDGKLIYVVLCINGFMVMFNDDVL